ncbi:peptidoglycan/LPS O-acetylase OafA/YrhL [Amaricoccus macauensis]|uniref:Peptidoglycan/LPS O-acetylase OafA/YrhL n=1 Tax=Amaricoccus macauensis TaxID=57001 RepID=A0A840SKH7_9RHOB|nr:VPEID-CTERM sorting domain-containing protein [Amaricoccus macauensis]MBB5221474.1 peptidoglycan/LPS O-acetylase OafA/YrhL [Amaricoccus macauensis]
MLLRLSLLALPLLLLAAPPTLAHCNCTPVSAPEIDAGSGLAALAAVGGMLAYAFERRRRP